MQKVLLDLDLRGVATIRLNRPQIHNAFDDEMIELLINKLQQLEKLSDKQRVRVLVLRSNGKHFSAGADLNWMRRMARSSPADNQKDAERLAYLMNLLNNLPLPVIALIQGSAYGGAIGLAACCDIVVATETGRFCLSETRLGLIPAVISPYVIRAIGERRARRYFLTAEPFSSLEAMDFGLIHEVVSDADQLEAAGERIIDGLLNNGPLAIGAAKALIAAVSHKPIDQRLIADTTRRIAAVRAGSEAREGLCAFLEKREPRWINSTKE